MAAVKVNPLFKLFLLFFIDFFDSNFYAYFYALDENYYQVVSKFTKIVLTM